MKLFSSLRFARQVTTAALLAPSLGLLSYGPQAQAQPDVNNAPKAENPTNRRPRNRARLADMPPEQRAKERLRRQLIELGATDVATQEAISAYALAEMTARQPVMEKGRQLQMGLRGNALSNAQVAALLNDYQAAIEEDKARQVKAQADLKKNVDFTKIPKVETLLTLMGIYGDGPAIMPNMMGFGAGLGNPNRLRPNGANQAAPAVATPAAAAPAAKP